MIDVSLETGSARAAVAPVVVLGTVALAAGASEIETTELIPSYRTAVNKEETSGIINASPRGNTCRTAVTPLDSATPAVTPTARCTIIAGDRAG
jgi:hypothetical protein